MQTTNTSTVDLPRAQSGSILSRIGILAYGITSYAIGVTGLCWLIAVSLGLVPFTGGPLDFQSASAGVALAAGFVLLFGVQHTIMARPEFKERWTRVIHPAAERPTFVLITGLIVCSMLWLWQPVEGNAWAFESPIAVWSLRSLGALGWTYLFAASFAIDHFHLFGLRQVWQNFRGTDGTAPRFVIRWMYTFDRHPIMSGMLVGLWCTPVMGYDHLMLAAFLTSYIAIGVLIEERTLVQLHGDNYREYRRRVPALVPHPGRR